MKTYNTKENAAYLRGRAEEKDEILAFIRREEEALAAIGEDESRSIADRFMHRIFAEMYEKLRHKIKFEMGEDV